MKTSTFETKSFVIQNSYVGHLNLIHLLTHSLDKILLNKTF